MGYSGYVNAKDLFDAIKKNHKDITYEQVGQLISKVDFAGKKQISYTEFVCAIMSFNSDDLDEERQDALFSIFDVEGTGEITKKTLKQVFNKIGRTVTDEQLDEIFSVYDLDQDGVINRAEWKQKFDQIIKNSQE